MEVTDIMEYSASIEFKVDGVTCDLFRGEIKTYKNADSTEGRKMRAGKRRDKLKSILKKRLGRTIFLYT